MWYRRWADSALLIFACCATVNPQDQNRPPNISPLSSNPLDGNYNNPYGSSVRPYGQDGHYDPFGPTPDPGYDNRYPYDDRNYYGDPQYTSVIKES